MEFQIVPSILVELYFEGSHTDDVVIFAWTTMATEQTEKLGNDDGVLQND